MSFMDTLKEIYSNSSLGEMVFSTQISGLGVLGVSTYQRPELYTPLVLVMGKSEAILMAGQCRNTRNKRPCSCMEIHSFSHMHVEFLIK